MFSQRTVLGCDLNRSVDDRYDLLLKQLRRVIRINFFPNNLRRCCCRAAAAAAAANECRRKEMTRKKDYTEN